MPGILRDGAIVSVPNAATRISDFAGNRIALHIHNRGATAVHIGDSNVAVATGFEIAAGDKIWLTEESCPHGDVYAIGAAVGPVDVFVQEIR